MKIEYILFILRVFSQKSLLYWGLDFLALHFPHIPWIWMEFCYGLPHQVKNRNAKGSRPPFSPGFQAPLWGSFAFSITGKIFRIQGTGRRDSTAQGWERWHRWGLAGVTVWPTLLIHRQWRNAHQGMNENLSNRVGGGKSQKPWSGYPAHPIQRSEVWFCRTSMSAKRPRDPPRKTKQEKKKGKNIHPNPNPSTPKQEHKQNELPKGDDWPVILAYASWLTVRWEPV